MVQLLEELPPELQAYIAGSLDDAAASGRWAKASRASRLLLLPRIDQLLEARRSARQQAVFDKLNSRRGAAAALSVNDMGNGVTAIRVPPFKLDKFTCICCPGNYERSIGAGGINVLRHLTSRTHWATYRQQVHSRGFDKVAWDAFAARASEFAGV